LAPESLNKDELFLHLSLVQGLGNKLQIAARRIFPGSLPHIILDAHTPDSSSAMRRRRILFRAGFVAERAWRHARALGPIARGAARWWLHP
jgi:hypothetical protein